LLAHALDGPNERKLMWYFAWLLGLPLAAAFAVLNAIWFELMDDEATRRKLLERTKSLPDA